MGRLLAPNIVEPLKSRALDRKGQQDLACRSAPNTCADLQSVLASESRTQILANQNTAHGFMGWTEKRARHFSGIAPGLNEGCCRVPRSGSSGGRRATLSRYPLRPVPYWATRVLGR